MEKGEKMSYIVTIDKETGLPVWGNSFVSVVRCKDCQYRGSTAECLERDDDWFCADGKRREDAETN